MHEPSMMADPCRRGAAGVTAITARDREGRAGQAAGHPRRAGRLAGRDPRVPRLGCCPTRSPILPPPPPPPPSQSPSPPTHPPSARAGGARPGPGAVGAVRGGRRAAARDPRGRCRARPARRPGLPPPPPFPGWPSHGFDWVEAVVKLLLSGQNGPAHPAGADEPGGLHAWVLGRRPSWLRPGWTGKVGRWSGAGANAGLCGGGQLELPGDSVTILQAAP